MGDEPLGALSSAGAKNAPSPEGVGEGALGSAWGPNWLGERDYCTGRSGMLPGVLLAQPTRAENQDIAYGVILLSMLVLLTRMARRSA